MEENKAAEASVVQPGNEVGVLYLTRAYNRGEISFDEWLERVKAWAERVIQEHKR